MEPLALGRISTTLAQLKLAYSVETFCLAFDIGRSTVYEEIRSGRLKAHKVGARTIIALEDGIAWLNGFCLGRYWSRGPQRTLYAPAPVTRRDGNELIFLELAATARGEGSGFPSMR